MEHTLTLEVTEEIYALLKQNAEQAGQPPEQLATQLLSTATRNLANDPLEPFIGAFRSQVADWADNHDQYLGKSAQDSLASTGGGLSADG